MGKKKQTPLGECDLELGSHFAGYRHGSSAGIRSEDVVYHAQGHRVVYRAVLPNGPQGRCTVDLPGNVKTVEAALRYLARTSGFKLK